MPITTVTGLTAERMTAMEQATVINGNIQGDNLHLQTRAGTDILAGNVRGIQGIQGLPGTNGNGYVLCTSTSRPTGLTAANDGLGIYEMDTKLFRVWIGNRWKCQERIICTSTTRPTTLLVTDVGVKIHESDTGYQYIWTGTGWGLLIVPPDSIGFAEVGPTMVPHEDIHNLASATTGNIAAAAYTNWPTPAAGGPCVINNFVKRRTDTKLIVSAGGTGYPVTAAGMSFLMGVYDGVTTVNIDSFYSNQAIANPDHWFHGGTIKIVGKVAGTYTFTLRMRKTGGAGGAWQSDTFDNWYLHVKETF